MNNFKKNIFKTRTDDIVVPTFTNDFCCNWACDDIMHVPPGGSVTYIDSDGNIQIEDGLCGGIPVTITYRSIVKTFGPTSIC